jgi:hypothetical protein
MLNNLIYVYGITDSPPDFIAGIEREGLESFEIGRFYVLFKYVAESEFAEVGLKRTVSDTPWLETHTCKHIEVIMRLMQYQTVFPLDFGSIFKSKEEVRCFIEGIADTLYEDLNIIRDMEEWTVKVYCNRKALSERIDEMSEEAASLEAKIRASSPAKEFLLKRRKIGLVENEMDRICKFYAQHYLNELRCQSESSHLHHLLPRDFTEREDAMILNTAFLVDKNKVNVFASTVNRLQEKDGTRSFIVECYGPLPPFSFVRTK